MSSERLSKMADSWLYSVMNLYLDNPGTGEFKDEEIREVLPKKHWESNRSILFIKEDFKNNIPEIMRELRDRGVIIVRKNNYYKIVNIKELIKSEYERNPKHFNKPLAKIEKNKEFWLGSK